MSEVSAAAAKAFIAMAPEHKVIMGFFENQCNREWSGRLALLFMRNKNWYTLGSP